MSGSTIGGTIGAAIGYYFGGPAGAQWGWAIGSMAGAYLMPEEIEGPRLSDLRPQGSEYGRPIPIIYGTAAVQGNVIWQSDLVEVASEAGGKGGGPEVTNFTYYANFAVLICEGEVELGRIWAGPEKRLIWDGTNLEGGGNITFYSGSTTQLPDPLMESYLGAGNVPAYRGWSYVVFENFPVANDGNRVPFLTIEVGEISSTSIDLGISWSVGEVFVDETWGKLICTFSGAVEGVIARNLDDNSFARHISLPSTYPGEFHSFYDSDRHMVVYVAGAVTYVDLDSGASGTVTLPASVSGYAFSGGVYHNGLWTFLMRKPGVGAGILTIDPGTLAVDNFYTGDAGSGALVTGFCGRRQEGDNYILGVTTAGTVRKYPISAGFTSTSIGSCVVGAGAAAVDPNTGYVWTAAFTGATLSVSCNDPVTAAQIYSDAVVTDASDWSGSGSRRGFAFIFKPATTPGTGRVLFPMERSSPIRDYFVEFDSGQDSVPALVGVTTGIAHGTGNISAGWWNPETDAYWVVRDYGYGNRSKAGNSLENMGLWLNDGTTAGFYFGQRDMVQEGELLSAIVADLCERAGVTSAQRDVSALTDTVDGYVIASQTQVQGAIQALQPAYFFDAVETGGKIKFVKRGGSIAVTIPDADLGARQSGSDPDVDLVETTRQMDDELPGVLNVGYMLRAIDYEVANKQARRIVGNSETEMRMDMAIVMTDEKAQGVADVNLHHAWVQRRTYRFSLPRKYSYLEPTDLVSVREQSMMLTKVTQAGGILKCEAFYDDYNYVPHVVVTETPNSEKEVYVVADTVLHLLGTNMLRDADDGLYFYAAACGENSNWDGAALYVSSDGGANYSRIGEFNYPATIGETENALGDYFGGNTVDELNSITVAMTYGTLSSTTVAGLLSGTNAAVVGQEILFFRDATLVSSGVYRLTGLLRGRRGTEHHIGRHTSGERFVLLSTATAIRLEGDTSEIGIYKMYKGVSYGQAIADAAAQSFMLEGNTLKPYAPVQLGGGRNAAGDVTINWVRRTRLAGSWRDSLDVPLGEASEEYAVDIMAGDSPSSVIRTISGITSQTTTYTAAQQTTDFGSPQATVYFSVYQISALQGRGFAGSGSV
jgi:hypothetical protein